MDSSEINLKEMNDWLLSILKCHTCSDYIMPPIFMCSNGHTFCETCSSKIFCYQKLSSGITCKEWMSGRNYTMEKVAELVIYPCKYASAGCDVKLRLNDMEKHEQDCLLRRLPCLFTECEWESNKSDYLQHLNNTHRGDLVVGTDKVVNVRSKSLVLTEWVFSAFDRFFLVKFTRNKTMSKFNTTNQLVWEVLCEGSMKEASKFYFTFSFSDAKNPHNSIQFSCTPWRKTVETRGRKFAIPIEGPCTPWMKPDAIYEDSLPIKINVHKIP